MQTTRAQLAERLGVSRATIHRMEKKGVIPRAKVVSLDRGRAGVWLAGLDELEAMVNRKAELANDVDAKALEVRILSHELSGANGKDAHAEMTKIMAEIEPMLGVES